MVHEFMGMGPWVHGPMSHGGPWTHLRQTDEWNNFYPIRLAVTQPDPRTQTPTII